MTPNAPPKMPPPPRSNSQAVAAPQKANTSFAVTTGRIDGPQKVLIYGTAGIGKSSLAGLAPNAVFLDIEGGTNQLDVPRIGGLESWEDLRAVMHSEILDAYSTIVIDTATKAEELAAQFVLRSVPHEKGHFVDRIESYGFGKGLAHIYETFLLLMQDCDRQVRRGRNIVLIAHDCINDVPNPVGDDFIRYEPHLQRPKSGKSDIRGRVVQWADHVLFLGYDVVARDGKGKGGGTRTIWTDEKPDHLAKVRGRVQNNVPVSLPYENGDGEIWKLILGGAS